MRIFPRGTGTITIDHHPEEISGNELGYSGKGGNGFGDGKWYGDGYGGSSSFALAMYKNNNAEYPYELIQYWK